MLVLHGAQPSHASGEVFIGGLGLLQRVGSCDGVELDRSTNIGKTDEELEMGHGSMHKVSATDQAVEVVGSCSCKMGRRKWSLSAGGLCMEGSKCMGPCK